ncbi:hypothetical protein TGRH88_071280 [Toxoplasma gondii]|uniref:Uncharacterized protein n=1 Tax=Toxoplasma gondii TaxID=5811 RepID=A0A7J6K296_TOXGO|nr:hypothetical protein TGRH88_071280 [Toxoplasma gondii]
MQSLPGLCAAKKKTRSSSGYPQERQATRPPPLSLSRSLPLSGSPSKAGGGGADSPPGASLSAEVRDLPTRLSSVCSASWQKKSAESDLCACSSLSALRPLQQGHMTGKPPEEERGEAGEQGDDEERGSEERGSEERRWLGFECWCRTQLGTSSAVHGAGDASLWIAAAESATDEDKKIPRSPPGNGARPCEKNAVMGAPESSQREEEEDDEDDEEEEWKQFRVSGEETRGQRPCA